QLIGEGEANRLASRPGQPELGTIRLTRHDIDGRPHDAAPRPTAETYLSVRPLHAQSLAGMFLDLRQWPDLATRPDERAAERMTTRGRHGGRQRQVLVRDPLGVRQHE